MERHFDQKLADLTNRMLKMAGAVELSIQEAVRCLVSRNDALVEKVIADGDVVDKMEVEVEEEALALFALRQPVASDLRLIAAVIKINTDLERINDQAANIAQASKALDRLHLLKPLIDIPRMADIAQAMVKNSLDAFVNRDEALAKSVCQRDGELDSLRDQIFRELLTYMMADPSTINRAIHLILVARHLERIGDHATNIAENVLHFINGRIVRHSHDEIAGPSAPAPASPGNPAEFPTFSP